MTYEQFIDNIIETRGRFACGEEYHERHHIKPRCMGGNNSKKNLVDLYPSEHFIAHKMLADENPDNDKLVRAYSAMAFMSNDYEHRYALSAEEYEEARKVFGKAIKALYSDKRNHPSYGTHISEERKQIISRANKGNKYCVGRTMSEETRKKISEANKNPSEETRKRYSQAQINRNLTYGRNPRAKGVVRLSDGKIYTSIKEAAEENGFVYTTFKGC